MIGAGVIEVNVAAVPYDRIRKTIIGFTASLPESRCVRLRVGSALPPYDVANAYRPDLVWQVVADTEDVLDAWQHALEGPADGGQPEPWAGGAR